MSVMIQIRNVPENIHRTLKARAAEAGMSLSDYALNELRQSIRRPTMAEMRARLEALPPIETTTDPVDIIRELRGPI
jgi:plasmid stability protein